LENGAGVDNETIVAGVATDLQSLTEQQSQGSGMTVGNLNASVDTVRRLAQLRTNFSGTPASKTEINVS
jgi:hypothetical protein